MALMMGGYDNNTNTQHLSPTKLPNPYTLSLMCSAMVVVSYLRPPFKLFCDLHSHEVGLHSGPIGALFGPCGTHGAC